MKTFLVLVLSVTAVFLWQRNNNDQKTEQAPLETSAPATVPSRAVSEHNWAKNSLDRTHEVMDQVQQAREQNEQR